MGYKVSEFENHVKVTARKANRRADVKRVAEEMASEGTVVNNTFLREFARYWSSASSKARKAFVTRVHRELEEEARQEAASKRYADTLEEIEQAEEPADKLDSESRSDLENAGLTLGRIYYGTRVCAGDDKLSEQQLLRAAKAMNRTGFSFADAAERFADEPTTSNKAILFAVATVIQHDFAGSTGLYTEPKPEASDEALIPDDGAYPDRFRQVAIFKTLDEATRFQRYAERKNAAVIITKRNPVSPVFPDGFMPEYKYQAIANAETDNFSRAMALHETGCKLVNVMTKEVTRPTAW